MDTIYIIRGGGQLISQKQDLASKAARAIKYETVEGSDWPDKAQCSGQNNYTTALWATDLATIQRWANEWAGHAVRLYPA